MLGVPTLAARPCWWLCLCFLSPCSHFPSHSPIVSKKQLFGILWGFFSFYFFPEENSIVLFIVVTARLLAATSFCSSCSPMAAGGPGVCAVQRCAAVLLDLLLPVCALFHAAAHQRSALLPLSRINEWAPSPRLRVGSS